MSTFLLVYLFFKPMKTIKKNPANPDSLRMKVAKNPAKDFFSLRYLPLVLLELHFIEFRRSLLDSNNAIYRKVESLLPQEWSHAVPEKKVVA